MCGSCASVYEHIAEAEYLGFCRLPHFCGLYMYPKIQSVMISLKVKWSV